MSSVKHLITFAKVYLSLVIIFCEEAKETFKYKYLIRITAPITTSKKKFRMLSNLLASFTSQVIPPTAAKGKSCLSLQSCKNDYQSLTFCDSSETSVPQSVRPLK